MEHEDYARNLLLASRNEAFLKVLLRTPPPIRNEARAPGKSNLELIGKATNAMLKWAKTGFSKVTDDVYEKRLTACQQCEFLSHPPNQLVYKLSLTKGENKSTCSSCGCVVSRKARLTSDTCPEVDPKNPGFNRWGEPQQSN